MRGRDVWVISIKRKNGKHYKDYFYYGCKHRKLLNGYVCNYNKQLQEEKINDAIAEVIGKLVSNPQFADMMQKKIHIKMDIAEVEKEIANFQKQLTKYVCTKRSIETQMDNLSIEDRHYYRKLSDLQNRLDKVYDYILDAEWSLKECKYRKKAIDTEKLTADYVYNILVHFDRLYPVMEDGDKRSLLTTLVKEIHIHEEAKPNGQWLKSMIFNLPIIEYEMELGLDNEEHVECVVLMSIVK